MGRWRFEPLPSSGMSPGGAGWAVDLGSPSSLSLSLSSHPTDISIWKTWEETFFSVSPLLCLSVSHLSPPYGNGRTRSRGGGRKEGRKRRGEGGEGGSGLCSSLILLLSALTFSHLTILLSHTSHLTCVCHFVWCCGGVVSRPDRRTCLLHFWWQLSSHHPSPRTRRQGRQATQN